MCGQISSLLDHAWSGLGLPLFLFPWVFQNRAYLVMLEVGLRRVWPMYCQHLWRISSCTGYFPVCCHISKFLKLFGQWIQRIHLRQVLLNVWILFIVSTVSQQVSAPSSRTGFTIELKILILVVDGRSRDPQTFLSLWKAALVLQIRTSMSASVPPSLLTTLLG